jgi:hypothetical protein
MENLSINTTNISYFEHVWEQPGTGDYRACYDAELLQGVCDAFAGGAMMISLVGLTLSLWGLYRAFKRSEAKGDDLWNRMAEVRYEFAITWVFLMMVVYVGLVR